MSIEVLLDGGREQPKRTTFEVLTQLILPLLLVLATIVSLLKDQRLLAWALMALVILSLAVSYSPLIVGKFKGAWNRRHDDRCARKAVPGFLRLLRRFE